MDIARQATGLTFPLPSHITTLRCVGQTRIFHPSPCLILTDGQILFVNVNVGTSDVKMKSKHITPSTPVLKKMTAQRCCIVGNAR